MSFFIADFLVECVILSKTVFSDLRLVLWRDRLPGRRILDKGRWPVGFRVEERMYGQENRCMGRLMNPCKKRVSVGSRNGRGRVKA
jgi:hypothetical protein